MVIPLGMRQMPANNGVRWQSCRTNRYVLWNEWFAAASYASFCENLAAKRVCYKSMKIGGLSTRFSGLANEIDIAETKDQHGASKNEQIPIWRPTAGTDRERKLISFGDK